MYDIIKLPNVILYAKEGRYMNFNLKRLRKEHNPPLSQKDMAKIIGIGESTYVRKENGEGEFSESEMSIISEYFSKSPIDIFFNS